MSHLCLGRHAEAYALGPTPTPMTTNTLTPTTHKRQFPPYPSVFKYIYFVDYLLNKEATEHNGAESYVNAQLANGEPYQPPSQTTWM